MLMAALTVHLVTNIQIRVSCSSATAISFSAQIRNMGSILGHFSIFIVLYSFNSEDTQ